MAPPSLTRNALDAMGLADKQHPLSITLEGSTFLANGHPILTQVPTNVVATPSPFVPSGKSKTAAVGCFVGFNAAGEPKSRHVFHIGKLKGIRFMRCGGALTGSVTEAEIFSTRHR